MEIANGNHRNNASGHNGSQCARIIFDMPKKSLKVDRKQFEGIVQNLLNTKPMKRDKVKVAKKKPHKLIPPQK